MLLFFISLFMGILVILIIDLCEYFFLGDRGKRNSISNYYKTLNGLDYTKKKKNPISKDVKTIREKTIKDYYMYVIPVCVGIFTIAYFVLGSLFIAIGLCLFSLLTPKILFNRYLNKKNETLSLQLKDAINSTISSLKAGLSLNSSIIKCVDDLEMIHTSRKEQYILLEFKKIKLDLNTGVSIEDALKNFRDRVKFEDADDFVNSILVVRQKGGNLVEVMDNVSGMITDKIAIKNEIKVLTASKKMEAKILTATPIVLIVILSLFSRDYLKPMIDTTLGKILVLFGFLLLTLNYLIGKKIVDIVV